MRLKNNKAITLIALVITIVVLLILAAVALNLTIGQNGIINRSKYAKESYLNAQDAETHGINSEIIDGLIGASLKKIEGIDTVTLAVDDTIGSTKLKVTATIQSSKNIEELNVASYEYYIYKGNDLVSKKTATENNLTFDNLEAGQEYSIVAVIYNDLGNANRSDVLTCTKKAIWDRYDYDAEGDYTYSCTGENTQVDLDRRSEWRTCSSLADCFNTNTGLWTGTAHTSYGGNPNSASEAADGRLIFSVSQGYTSNVIYELTGYVGFIGQWYVRYNCNAYSSSGTTTYTKKGNPISTVSNTSPNAYPDDGYQNGGYYVKK